MDINIIRSIATVVALISFLGIVWWAYSGKNAERFREDALLPFALDDESPLESAQQKGSLQ